MRKELRNLYGRFEVENCKPLWYSKNKNKFEASIINDDKFNFKLTMFIYMNAFQKNFFIMKEIHMEMMNNSGF